MENLSVNAYRYIWSAIHQPQLKDHTGFTILNLFISNTRTVLQRNLFEEFAKTRNPANAETILVEMQNLLFANATLENDVRAALQAGNKDPLLSLPEIRSSAEEESTFSQHGNFNRDLIIGVALLAIGLICSFIPGGKRIFLGLIVAGFLQIIKVLAR